MAVPIRPLLAKFTTTAKTDGTILTVELRPVAAFRSSVRGPALFLANRVWLGYPLHDSAFRTAKNSRNDDRFR